MQSYGPWFIKLVPDQDFPHGPVKVCHLNPVQSGVGPVDFPTDRIYDHPVRGVQTVGNDVLHVGTVQIGTHHFVQYCVGPVDFA